MSRYNLIRFHLSLSSFAGIVFGASHWWCKLRWVDDVRGDLEADAERGRGWRNKQSRFDTKAAARAAGLRLAKRLADGRYYVVTEGSWACVDPQPVLSAPGNLKERANALLKKFEELGCWDGPKSDYPKVTALCDRWSQLVGSRR